MNGFSNLVLVRMSRAVLAAAALLFAGAGHAAAQISVDELEVFIRPGANSQAGIVRITNDSDKPVQVLIELQDWSRDTTGANQFVPFKSLKRSCGDALKVFPMSLRLEPKESQPLRVTFEGPEATSCWNVVFVQGSEPRTTTTAQSQITYIIRTGVKVYVQAPGAVRDGEVMDVKMIPADSVSPRRLAVLFRNPGEAHLKAKGALEIRRADNSLASRIVINEFPLEPGGRRWITVDVPTLANGDYIALALIDFGGTDIAAGQLEFTLR
jgi:P pilus assembly chaperone PapD